MRFRVMYVSNHILDCSQLSILISSVWFEKLFTFIFIITSFHTESLKRFKLKEFLGQKLYKIALATFWRF